MLNTKLRDKRNVKTKHPNTKAKVFFFSNYLIVAGIAVVIIPIVLVLSLIPVYIPTKTLTVGYFQSALLQLRYGLPNSLFYDANGNTLTINFGSLSSVQVKQIESILQSKLGSNPKYKNLRIILNDARIESTSGSHKRAITDETQEHRTARLANDGNIVLHQSESTASDLYQCKISFYLQRTQPLSQNLISSVLRGTLPQIEFDAATFFDLFTIQSSLPTSSPTVPDVAAKAIINDVKDTQVMTFDGVNVFGLKDFSGNVQSIYAIQTSDATYSIDNGLISRIQSSDEALLFNYDNNNNTYTVLLVLKNNTYKIPMTYNTPNITFPSPEFSLPPNTTIEEFLTGIIVDLTEKISNKILPEATIQLNYFDANDGHKSTAMINMGAGRYYVPLPTGDTSSDSFANSANLLHTSAQQCTACAQLMKSYPILDICSKIPTPSSSFCSSVANDMLAKIPDALSVASNQISDIPIKPRSYGQLSDFNLVIFLPGEDPITTSLNTNTNNNINSKSSNLVATNNNIDLTKLNTFSVPVGTRRGQCNSQTVSGNDVPDTRIIEFGQTQISFKFSYQTYTIKDQIDIYYMDNLVFTTRCVGASGSTSISQSGLDTTTTIQVTPDCAGESGTAWYYTIECPEELICEGTVCYCGLTHKISHQKRPVTFNGCGGEKSMFNRFITPLGEKWKFTPSCNQHDTCYGTCNNAKTTCDQKFLVEMLNSCLTNFVHSSDYQWCKVFANGFYYFVNHFGSTFFTGAQTDDCDCPLS